MLFWGRSLAVGARQERHHFEHDAPTDLGCDSHPSCPVARLDLSVASNFG